MTPVFASYYTPEYKEHAMRLQSSLDHFRLQSNVVEIGQTATWIEAVRQKPKFILDTLDKAGGRAVVWLDADAEVVQFPKLLRDLISPDVACVYRHDSEPLSGTVWVNNTVRGRALISRWAQYQESQVDWPDGLGFRNALATSKLGLRIERLPVPYCAIFDAPDMMQCSPVVIHSQYSRHVCKTKPRV